MLGWVHEKVVAKGWLFFVALHSLISAPATCKIIITIIYNVYLWMLTPCGRGVGGVVNGRKKRQSRERERERGGLPYLFDSGFAAGASRRGQVLAFGCMHFQRLGLILI